MVALERHNTPPPEQKWFLLLPATAAADLALTAFLATHLEHCVIFLKHPKPACFFHLALASWACRSPHRPDRQSASSSRIRNSYESSSLSRYSAKWSFRVRGAEVLHPACFCLPGDRLRLKTFLVVTTPSEWERNAAGTSWVEAREAATHPACHRTAPPTPSDLAPDHNSAEAEKPFQKGNCYFSPFYLKFHPYWMTVASLYFASS